MVLQYFVSTIQAQLVIRLRSYRPSRDSRVFRLRVRNAIFFAVLHKKGHRLYSEFNTARYVAEGLMRTHYHGCIVVNQRHSLVLNLKFTYPYLESLSRRGRERF